MPLKRSMIQTLIARRSRRPDGTPALTTCCAILQAERPRGRVAAGDACSGRQLVRFNTHLKRGALRLVS